jgi:hypothetical protein
LSADAEIVLFPVMSAVSAILLADTSGKHSLEKADERTILSTLAIKPWRRT